LIEGFRHGSNGKAPSARVATKSGAIRQKKAQGLQDSAAGRLPSQTWATDHSRRT
jgi:hypothetical protein